MDLATVDQETSRLLVQVQLDDIRAMQAEMPDKACDLAAAVDLYKAELETYLSEKNDEDKAEQPEPTSELDTDSSEHDFCNKLDGQQSLSMSKDTETSGGDESITEAPSGDCFVADHTFLAR